MRKHRRLRMEIIEETTEEMVKITAGLVREGIMFKAKKANKE